MPARVSSIVALLATLAFAAACGRPAPDRAASTDTAAVETAWRDPVAPTPASPRDPDACTLISSEPPKPPHDTAIAFADLREDVRGVRGFTCRLRGDSHLRVETVGDDEWNRVDELRIYPRDRLPLQVLKASDESGAPPRGSDYLTAPDLDGDGWSDLMLVKWSGATGNTAHDVWLYRPGERRFVHDSALSEQINLRRRPDGCLDTSSHGGGALRSSAVLCRDGGRFVPVRVETEEPSEDGRHLIRTVYERKDGRLVLVRTDTLR